MTKSVIVFDIDGLSIRTAGCYGNVETQTPLLNEFAAQARVFEQHYRMVVDSDRDRDMMFETLRGDYTNGLLAANTVTESCHDVITLETMDGLAGLLEEQFDTENHAAVVRLRSEAGYLDRDFPLSLISQLIEAHVDVVVTSTAPLIDVSDYRIQNEAAVRVPLMIWCPSAERVQGVTSGYDLPDLLRASTSDSESAIVRSDDMLSLREADAMLLVSRELLHELEQTPDADLAGVLNVTDSRIQLFRKPDDVWNIHNIIVEDVQRAIDMLSRLRRETAE